MGKLVTTNNISYLLLLPIQFNEPMNFHFVDLSTLETKVSNKMSIIGVYISYYEIMMFSNETMSSSLFFTSGTLAAATSDSTVARRD